MIAQHPLHYRAAALAAGVELLLGLALVLALASPVPLTRRAADALAAIDFTPPPAQPTLPPRSHHAPSGAAAPAAPRAQAAAVTAPPTVLAKPIVPAAPTAGLGEAIHNGAADAGAGSGAGGEGLGTGAGADGMGDGDGGADPELIAGRISDHDIPIGAFHQRFEGTTSAQLTVDSAGQVSQCRVTRSSGNAMLDGLTCRLVQQRFRFRAARDGAGRPVASRVDYDQDWSVTGQWDDAPER